MMCALLGIRTSMNSWHDRVGHPSIKVFHSIFKPMSLPVSSSLSPSFHCHSCLSNKSHKPPFGHLSLVSRGPLDLVHSNVWGPSSLILSINLNIM